jgi:tyrosyl-tRNA synthetase
MDNVLDVLESRGFIEQTTHDAELRDYLASTAVTCYIGFDPTASSLHVGSLVPIMSLAHMQRSGHRPIALVGGGTGLVGDPSGKTEMRKLLTVEDVAANVVGLKRQLARYIDFSEGRAVMVNNADWLTQLAYIPFLRDIGRYFSVNRMIKAESYKMRLDSDEGLSFIEFNYMVLQAYDFLELRKRYDCRLQMGGSDQWGNIVAGIDLIRRVEGESAFGITFPLITTASGAKMGKTAAGAVWLDPERTSPYDYYQFWVNTDDRDVVRFLSLFTFLPLSEIRAVDTLAGADLNAAKSILAFEATRLAHGEDEALKAYSAAVSMFGLRHLPTKLLPTSAIPRNDNPDSDDTVPQVDMPLNEFDPGIPAFKLFHRAGLTDSSGAARRLLAQGGGYLNGRRLERFDEVVTTKDIKGMEILLRAGKKHFLKICVQSGK